MCISFYCIEPNNSNYKLILTFNRDEFLDRPTALAKWQNGVLAGWDLPSGRKGGTWLGVDKSGKIAFLTNIYGVMDRRFSSSDKVLTPIAYGRGRLVVEWLEGKQGAEDYLCQIKDSQTNYAPFNLVLFEPGKVGYNVWQYTRGKSGHTKSFGPECVSLGIHGISNHTHHQDFNKTQWGKTRMEEIMKKGLLSTEAELVEEIEEMMSNVDLHWPDPQINRQSDSESKVYSFRNKIASVFVNVDGLNYGTRTTTTILVDIDNNVSFREKTLEDGEWKITEEKFQMGGSGGDQLESKGGVSSRRI